MDENKIELIAERVHNRWIADKLSQGITSRLAEDGEEQMVKYSDLSEKAKDIDRATVRTVLAAMDELENR